MAGRIICLLFFIGSGIFIQAKAQAFDKAAFYKVMENGNTGDIDKQLKIIETTSNFDKEAYSGALLMKKAGLTTGASKKLNFFKSGRAKLEAAIEQEKDNVEWHFLRLIIQENAPKILGYKSDIKSDAAMVHSVYKKLSPEVQAAVMDYRKHSNTLQALNF